MILHNASLPRQSLRGETRYQTSTESTTYSDADLDASLNAYYDLFVTEILESMDEWDFSGEIATADIVLGQTEYIVPSDILKFKRLEITLDGTTWHKAEALDINEVGEATDATTRGQNFVSSEPFFDLMDNSLILYNTPSVNVTAGIKIWYEKLPTQLSAVTDSPTFARPFHKGLCYGASKDHFERFLEIAGNDKKKANAETNLENYIARMKIHYRKKNQDRQYIVGAAEVNYDYGSDN